MQQEEGTSKTSTVTSRTKTREQLELEGSDGRDPDSDDAYELAPATSRKHFRYEKYNLIRDDSDDSRLWTIEHLKFTFRLIDVMLSCIYY